MKKSKSTKLVLAKETLTRLDLLSEARGNADEVPKSDGCEKPSWATPTCGLCPYSDTMRNCPIWV